MTDWEGPADSAAAAACFSARPSCETDCADVARDAPLVRCCRGAHCNGATTLASRISALGFGVREMRGGVWGWEQEGFALETGS